MDYEIKANKYSLSCIVYSLAAAWFVLICNELNIFINDKMLVRKSVLLTTIVFVSTFIFFLFVKLDKVWVKYVLMTVEIIGIYIMCTFLSYHVVLVSGVPFLIAGNYQEKKITWYTYAISLIGSFIAVLYGYEHGLCDMNMVALTYGPVGIYGKVVYVPIKELNIDHTCKLILFFVTTRVVILFLYAKMALYIAKNGKELHEHKLQAEYESKYDKMTGLYSKNEYLKKLEEVYPNIEKLGIIYMDVNGLKDVNDKYGHDKGDLLICTVADSIKHILDDNIDAYRIGGDEFVLIVNGAKEDELSCLVERWSKVIKIMNETAKNCICEVAVGYASGSGKDIENVKNMADYRMYENKQRNKKSKIINS